VDKLELMKVVIRLGDNLAKTSIALTGIPSASGVNDWYFKEFTYTLYHYQLGGN